MAQKMEQDFFRSGKKAAPDDRPLKDEAGEALRLLQENPDMAKLIIAAFGRTTGS